MILRQQGLRAHPNSGAGEIKEDGSDDYRLVQVKSANRTITLSSKELRATLVRALQQGKMPCWLIHFSEGDFTLECRLIPGGRELTD